MRIFQFHHHLSQWIRKEKEEIIFKIKICLKNQSTGRLKQYHFNENELYIMNFSKKNNKMKNKKVDSKVMRAIESVYDKIYKYSSTSEVVMLDLTQHKRSSSIKRDPTMSKFFFINYIRPLIANPSKLYGTTSEEI